jgi:hypothetical protein
MLGLTLMILFWISVVVLSRYLRNNKHEELLFALDMGINTVLIIWLNIIGLILVMFFEYKHVKRAFNNKSVKDFVYGRC